jgi:allophanate hydrolase
MDESPSRVAIVVVGAHLRGQPLNRQLTDRDATFVQATTTAPGYRLFALDTEPPKPGLVRTDPGDDRGRAIEVEVWELGVAEFGDFVAQIPAPLCIGRVRLADGREVSGFLCEPFAIAQAVEITQYGGWRAYRSSADDRS